MAVSDFGDRLRARPQVVSVAAAAMLASALVQLVVWIVWPEQVVSNGGQVFFIMLWTVLAHVTFKGAGWARYAIAAIFVVAIWGVVNAASPLQSLAGLAPWEMICGGLQAGALALLCLPRAHRWFSAVSAADADS